MAGRKHYDPPDNVPPGIEQPPSLVVHFLNGPLFHLISAGPCLLTGWSVINRGAAAQTLIFMDGTDASGNPFGWSHSGPQGTDTQRTPEGGIWCRSGLTLSDPQQVYEGAAWIIPL